LGINTNFCKLIAEVYIDYYQSIYAELKENRQKVYEVMEEEENKFNKTLLNGEKEFNNIIKNLESKEMSGQQAFTLYESYGFPVEIIEDLCKENGLFLDKKGFEEARTKHQEMSRAGSEQKFKGGLADSSEIVVKYHTATHLLHEALKRVLGPDANQRGSNITAERLRFDFTHNTKMTPDEIKKTEDLVNEWISAKLPVTREELPKEEALKRGAMHLFGEKYGDTVSIYTVGNLHEGKSKVKGENENIKSVEFCGGPHVNNTSEIGEGNKKFKITKEEAVSAGVRRIKAQLV
jgi:alanyl-tRNA synthetase